MAAIERHGSGGAWEATVGYARVLRAGDLVLVAGTTATTPDGAIAGVGDTYAQVRQTLDNIEAALARVGATLVDVVRTRVFLTPEASFDGFGRAHFDVFGEIKPVNTTVVVAALADPRMLVEIEVDAYLGAAAG